LFSASLSNTANWLNQKYKSFGYDVKIDTFSYLGISLYNVIAIKHGTFSPEKYLIICGHYDTKNGPGTNDNGSGVSTTLEIARVLKSINTNYSIMLINFTGEESGFIGSNHFINTTIQNESLNVFFVFNIDEVGGVSGLSNNIIRCEQDETNPASNNTSSALYTDTVTNLVELYSNLSTIITNAYGSDYMPFQDDGYVISGFYENNESTHVHSSSDLLSNLDTSYVWEVAKASSAVALYFSKAYENSTSNYNNILIKDILRVYPIPCKANLIIDNYSAENLCVVFYDYLSNIVFTSELKKGQNIINTEKYNQHLYLYKIYDLNDKSIVKEGKFIKIN